MKNSLIYCLAISLLIIGSMYSVGCVDKAPPNKAITEDTFQFGDTTVAIQYPLGIEPATGAGFFQWTYWVTFSDKSGHGYKLLKKKQYFTKANGDVLTVEGHPIKPEIFEREISPYGKYTDDSNVRSGIYIDSFEGGKVHLTYFGVTKDNINFEIPVEFGLQNKVR